MRKFFSAERAQQHTHREEAVKKILSFNITVVRLSRIFLDFLVSLVFGNVDSVWSSNYKIYLKFAVVNIKIIR
jgi:hypothetical protein